MAIERRATQRRSTERRGKPSEAYDVTRLEHENLTLEVMKNGNQLRRVEQELNALQQLVNRALLRIVTDESAQSSRV